MTHIGPSIHITGDVFGEEDVTIQDRVTGSVVLRDHTVVITQDAHVDAGVRGARVIVLGEVNGRVTASDRIELGPSSTATGSLSGTHVVIIEGSPSTDTSTWPADHRRQIGQLQGSAKCVRLGQPASRCTPTCTPRLSACCLFQNLSITQAVPEIDPGASRVQDVTMTSHLHPTAVFAVFGLLLVPAALAQDRSMPAGLSHDAHMPQADHFGRHFDNAAEGAKSFDDPARDEWQMPAQVIDALQLKSGQVVADIGAGTGYFTVRLAKSPAAPKVYAVDIERSMVEYVKQRAVRDGLKNVVAVQAGADRANLPEPVDLVLVVDTYHHIPNRVAYFTALKDRMKAGARLAIVDFRKGAPSGPPEEFRFTPDQISVELAKAGFALQTSHDFLPRQIFLVYGVK